MSASSPSRRYGFPALGVRADTEICIAALKQRRMAVRQPVAARPS